jgi:hypothetical protein
MSLNRILIVMVLLLIPVVSHAWNPGTCILGPGDGVSGGPASDDLSTNGQDADTQWKVFRWQAGGTGDIYLWAVRVQSIPGNVASEDLTYAVYEDNNGNIGNLKAWGYRLDYNWHTIGIGRHYFDLAYVGTDRRVTAGRYYWIAFRSSTDNTNRLYFERQGSDPLPNWIEKRGVTVPAGNFNAVPPSGSSYSVGYADNYYGWSVWTAADSDRMPPSPPMLQ